MRTLIFTLLISCSSGGPPPGPAGSVTIVNQSQYDLEELRVHDAPEYLGTQNLLANGLPIDAQILFYGEGDRWITVLRERYRNGPILAFTTSEPIAIEPAQGYRLTIFDESFRFEDATWIDPDTAGLQFYGEPFPQGR